MEYIINLKLPRRIKSGTLFLALLLSKNINAQSYNPDYIRYYAVEQDLIFFRTNPVSGDHDKILDAVFNFDDSEYRLKEAVSFGENDSHFLYELYYKGIKAEDYKFAVHFVGDSISGSGELLTEEWNFDVQSPAIDESEAISVALNDMDSEEYYWLDSLSEMTLKEITNNPDTSYYPRAFLCIYNNALCYKLRIYSMIPLITVDYFIDANSGEIVSGNQISAGHCFTSHASPPESICETDRVKENILPHPHPSAKTCFACSWSGCHGGTADIFFYGNGKTIEFEQFSNNTNGCWQRLKDYCNPALLYVKQLLGTTNMQNQTHWSAHDITMQGPGKNWGTNDQDGTTALWSIKRAYEYFSSIHSRVSYNNSSSGSLIVLTSATVAGLDGKASWNGGGNIVLGHADAGCSGEMKTIDVAAHELAHGVIENACGLPTTGYGGSINESFADIFANHADYVTKQNFSTGQPFDYLVSNEACSGGKRDLANPLSKSMPDTYKVSFWTDSPNIDTHKNMGVLGYWYYLLAEGSNGTKTNGHGIAYCVKPIGRDKVAKIIYRALTGGYYTSGLSYTDIRQKTVWAASDMYGYWSPEVAEIQAAFHAVSIGYNGTFGVNAETPSDVATMPFVLIGNKTETGNQAYHFNNTVRHHRYTVASGANVEVTSNNEIVFTPLPWDPTGEVTIGNGATYVAYITPACSGNGSSGARPFDPGSDISSDQPQILPGSQLKGFFEDEKIGLSIIPNPNTGTFKISLNKSVQLPGSLKIIDDMGKTVYENDKLESFDINVDIKNSPAGIYLVKVNYLDEVIIKKIIKVQ